MDSMQRAALDRAYSAIKVAAHGQDDDACDFVRLARATAFGRVKGIPTSEAASRLYPDLVVKAPVASADSGSALQQPSGASVAFVEAVRPLTILGRLATRAVPFNAHLPFLTAGLETFDFWGESQPIGVSAAALGNLHLSHTRISGLVVATNTLLEYSESEQVLRRDMIAATVAATDRRLLDPESDDGDGIRPAAITHDADEVDASGAATAEDVDGVTAVLAAGLSLAGSTLTDAVYITTPMVALALAMLRDPNGNRAFPNVSIRGGELAGLPLLVSASAPAGCLIAADGGEILVADDGAASIANSQAAFIDQAGAPEGAQVTSMFQAESTAIRVTRWINWGLRRPFVTFASGLDVPLPDLPTTA